MEVFQINLNSKYLLSKRPNVHKDMIPVIYYIAFFFLSGTRVPMIQRYVAQDLAISSNSKSEQNPSDVSIFIS